MSEIQHYMEACARLRGELKNLRRLVLMSVTEYDHECRGKCPDEAMPESRDEDCLACAAIDFGMPGGSTSPLPEPGAEGAATSLGWHVISGEHLLDCLRRVAKGENPDLVFAELWANADHDRQKDTG